MDLHERGSFINDLRQLVEWCGPDLPARLAGAEDESEVWRPDVDRMGLALTLAMANDYCRACRKRRLRLSEADVKLRAAWQDLGFIYRLLLDHNALSKIVIDRNPLAWPYPFTFVGILSARPSLWYTDADGEMDQNTRHPYWRQFESLGSVGSYVYFHKDWCQPQIEQLVAGLYPQDQRATAAFVLR